MTLTRPHAAPGRAVILLLGLLAVSASIATAQNLSLPYGYFDRRFAVTGAPPTALTFGGDGWLYVAEISGDVLAFRDTDQDGFADTSSVFATGIEGPLGIAGRAGRIYVSCRGRVVRYTDLDGDHVADTADTLVTSLPTGRHQNSGIAFGPDGDLYVTLGTITSLGVQSDSLSGTILRYTSEGAFVEIFAHGFRNPYDLAFNGDGELFATDNSPSADSTFGCEEAPDELNWIRRGRNYGFPYCFGTGDCYDVSAYCDPPPCGAGACQWGTGCSPSMTSPIWLLEPHCSSDGLVFGTGFAGYGPDDLFIAEFGQEDPTPDCPWSATGHKVVHVRLARRGHSWSAVSEEDFATGFFTPLDLAVGPDSALYVCDYLGQRINRIARAVAGAVPEGRPGSPLRFSLSPNPARGPVALRWEAIPPEGEIRVDVLDVAGRQVASLGSFRRPEAFATVRWGLADDAGRRVPAGLYLVRARTGSVSAVQKLLVVN